MPSSVIYNPSSGTETLPVEDMFERKQPLEVDVGCGKGRFLIARASAHPEVNFIGIDRMLKRIRKVEAKIERAGLSNVRLLRLESLHAIRQMMPDKSVTTLYIFFPDPWPKRRHQRRRLFTPELLDSICSVLVEGGQVHTMTDHADYAVQIHSLFMKHPGFQETVPPEFPEEQRTDFELVFMRQNRQIARFSFQNKGHPRLSGTSQATP